MRACSQEREQDGTERDRRAGCNRTIERDGTAERDGTLPFLIGRTLNSGMGYRTVDTAAVEATPDRPCRHRGLADLGELTTMAINRFEAEPGEQLPVAYHYHDDQQEAFL